LSPRATRISQLKTVALAISIAISLTKGHCPHEAGIPEVVAKAAAVADVIERCLAEFDAVRIWQQLSVRWPAVDEQKLPRDECTN
jgi:hypothetical protein